MDRDFIYCYNIGGQNSTVCKRYSRRWGCRSALKIVAGPVASSVYTVHERIDGDGANDIKKYHMFSVLFIFQTRRWRLASFPSSAVVCVLLLLLLLLSCAHYRACARIVYRMVVLAVATIVSPPRHLITASISHRPRTRAAADR